MGWPEEAFVQQAAARLPWFHNMWVIVCVNDHLRLRCFVVVELKTGSFLPEYAGKMNFYLSAVDAQFRHASDQPTIGILLCKDRKDLVVEYALRDLGKPIGVANWETRLVESLPEDLVGSLPTVAEMEAELEGLEDERGA